MYVLSVKHSTSLTYTYFEYFLTARQSIVHGTNAYGILRAPRSAGHEGLTIAAPIKTTGPFVRSNAAGVGMVLALAKFFAERNFWSRDIAFVVPAFDMVGMQAWLNAYSALPHIDGFDSSKASDFKLAAAPLDARCGAMQAAIVLELGPVASPPRFDLRLEGVNGLMPNLDLVNLVVRVSEKHGVPISLQNRTDPKNMKSVKGFTDSLQTIVKQMGTLAQFSPSGMHGLFLPLRIEALTMSSEPPRPSKRMEAGAADLLAVGRLLEAIFRSINNLQEKFHQSFFFYLLPHTHLYVSIGPYMGAFGAILAAPLLHALSLWVEARTPPEGENTKDLPLVTPVWPFLIISLSAGMTCNILVPHLWKISMSSFGLYSPDGFVLSFATVLLTLMLFVSRSPLFKGTILNY